MNQTVVVMVRGTIAFISLLIFTRLLGKQQISQLTFFHYALGISIGSMAANLTININNRAWPSWVGLITITGLAVILQVLTLNSRLIAKYIDGEPTVLIMNGKIMDEALKKVRLQLNDLQAMLRQKNIFDMTQVEFAVLETSGKLSVLKRSQYQTLTPLDLNLPTSYSGLSTELIYDGIVIYPNLAQVNLDYSWLLGELRKQKVNDPAEVFLASLGTDGALYIDTYADRLQNLTDPSDYSGPN